jgi:hypothetical protein
MEYSLQSLNKSAHFKALTLKEIVENLNLIGFEVDEIFLQNSEINSLSQNIKFLLKVPANREDLMVEELLIKEFNRLFSLNFFSNWKILKKNSYSPMKDITYDEKGIIIPTENFSDEFKEEIMKYFRERKEDE